MYISKKSKSINHKVHKGFCHPSPLKGGNSLNVLELIPLQEDVPLLRDRGRAFFVSFAVKKKLSLVQNSE